MQTVRVGRNSSKYCNRAVIIRIRLQRVDTDYRDDRLLGDRGYEPRTNANRIDTAVIQRESIFRLEMQ